MRGISIAKIKKKHYEGQKAAYKCDDAFEFKN